MESLVTVIIPSYNRAHLLEKTIPTYLQEGVKEIILIDDCSSDNTSDVVKKLQLDIPQLKYIRQPRNMKQPSAKNRGLDEITTPWVYFGDDDSILYPGSIQTLFDTCIANGVDGCGACALYMHTGDEKLPLETFVINNRVCVDDIQDIVDMENNFHVNFSLYIDHPIRVPFCHAACLMKSDIAKKVKFDPLFLGNAYREETDFFIRCTKVGATFMYNPKASQINLPSFLATGGARGKSVWKYKYWMIRNNWRFLRKNFDFLKQTYNLKTTKYKLQFEFTAGFVLRPLKKILSK